MKKVVLVIDASSGIGKETARIFAHNDFKLIAAHILDRMKDLEKSGCLRYSPMLGPISGHS